MARTGGGQGCGAHGVLAHAAFEFAFGVVHPHIAAGIDHGPRLVAGQRALDRVVVRDVHVLARQQAVRQVALFADAGKGAAQRAGRAQDQDRRGRGAHQAVAVGGDGCEGVGRGHRLAHEAPRTAPPALRPQYRVRQRLAGREFSHQCCQRGRAWQRRAHVERARLVIAVLGGDEAVPVERAKQRPDCDRADIDAVLARLLRRFPDFKQPAHLVFAVAVDVRFGDGQRDAVAFPDLEQQRGDAGRGRGQHARGFDVGAREVVGHAAVVRRIALGAMIEPALAGDVVIGADDVGRAGIVAEPENVGRIGAAAQQIVPERMVGADHAAEQVPAQPAAFVVELGDVGQFGRAVGLAEIVGLDQLGIRIDGADRAHRQHRCAALVEQCLDERTVVAAVRVPHAVQAGKARRGADLVDRGVVLEPWIARGDGAGIVGQALGKARIDQARVARAAAVVDQAGDRGDAGVAQRIEALVGPAPVGALEAVGRGALPQHRVADGANAERGEAVDIAGAVGMTVTVELAEIRILHTVDGAFEAAPKFQWVVLAVRALVHGLLFLNIIATTCPT